jgi:Cdc6-like AAA superfamily ATPase
MVFGSVNDSKRYQIRKTMRTEVFRKMTKDELDNIIEQYPIGKMDTAKALAAVLDKVMDWDGDAMGSKGDPKVAMTVLDKLMDMNEMKGKGKIVTTHQIEASTVENTLADIQEKKKLFKATQTEVLDGIPKRSEQKEKED